MFEVVKFVNPLARDYIHEYEGKKFKLKAGWTYDLPYAVARDVAYYVSQFVCKSRNLPLFGTEHDNVINELLGIDNPDLLPKDEYVIDAEEFGMEEKEVEDVPELRPSNDAFTPTEAPTETPEAPRKWRTKAKATAEAPAEAPTE